ncbi:hypothetical protein Pyn_07504 [Prunus yedoensis var. nudiflora]|uniref:Uncharacterized protein n=1 Tax=Prunus yedoensis var. nudiflora TaxID=2094558 RepID=A0A314UL55_PRUYE|nr:hypothetical protein Pyn_07504 [Prunus yedoensis var. nudiflora]
MPKLRKGTEARLLLVKDSWLSSAICSSKTRLSSIRRSLRKGQLLKTLGYASAGDHTCSNNDPTKLGRTGCSSNQVRKAPTQEFGPIPESWPERPRDHPY